MDENYYGRRPEDGTMNDTGYQQNDYYTAGGGYQYQPQQPPKKGSGGFTTTLLKTVAIALVFGLVVSSVFVGIVKVSGIELGSSSSVVTYKNSDVSSTAEGLAQSQDISGIIDSVMPSIVAITNTAEAEVQSFFGSQTQTYQDAGSGIIIGKDSESIYVVTNNHVVEGTIDLKVTFSDNETVDAEVKGTDPGSDLAVVKVNLSDLKESTLKTIKVAVMGDSSQCKVGEPVIAIGNALGYGQSVTTGVVSALDRSVTVENYSNTLMQTDAAINPGNSGGALLNSAGEVIGINSAKYSDTSVEGIGYAIPISDAQPIIEAIITREAVDETERGYLGIYGTDVTEDFASVYNMPIGVYINQLVQGGAAEEAGLVEGDIITGIEDFDVSTMTELQSQLKYYSAGQEVTIKAQVKNGGKYVEKTFKVTLQENRERR
ncbi:MAG: S1C family serine protease [Lachnospiraceae bacterium]